MEKEIPLGPSSAPSLHLDSNTGNGIAEYYRRLLDVLPDALVLYDLEGRIVYINDSFMQLYGWTRGECYGKKLDFLPPDELDRTAEAITRSLTGENVRIVTRRFTKEGKLIDVLLITSLMKDEKGLKIGIYVVHRDLTERKAMAAALEESQKLYRTLLDASPDPISVYDAEGLITYVNPAFEQTFGWTIKELSGKGVDFVPPHELERTIAAVKRTLEGERVSLDTQRLTKAGRLVDIQLKTAIFKDSDGRTAGDIVIYRDITEHTRIERELKSYRDHLEELVRQRTAALTESRERFRELAEMLPEIVFEVDSAGKIQFINKRGMEVLGLTEGDLGVAVDITSRAVPEDRERLRENLRLRLAGMKQRGVEYTFQKSDGRSFPALAITNPILTGGAVSGLRGIIVDISSHKSMEEQLRHAAKMEAVGTLAGGIAHDFNNILQTILGQVQLIQAEHKSMEMVMTRLGHVEHAAERAAGLVKQLMAFGRKVDATLTSTDMNLEIERVLDILDRTIPKMIRITCDLSPDTPPIMADPAQMVQILLNLCTNARDAMADGGVLTISTRRVEIGKESAELRPEIPFGEYLLLTVSDDGAGMDEETLGHIFEPFFTTKEVGKGSGLGLSTVYGIVKSHGGFIFCESKQDEGTTFRIYFPATLEPPEAKTVQKPKQQLAYGDETILVADDDESVLELAKAILEHQGYTVITATRGEEALEIFARTPKRFDLVILDLGMPGMGGRRCMEAMLKIAPGTLIIIASGYSTDREASGVMEAGAAEFVGKPYRLAELGIKVRELLDRNTH